MNYYSPIAPLLDFSFLKKGKMINASFDHSDITDYCGIACFIL